MHVFEDYLNCENLSAHCRILHNVEAELYSAVERR